MQVMSIVKKESRIMSVDKVVEAFHFLMEDETRNGAALCLPWNGMPPFYYPSNRRPVMYMWIALAYIVKKMFPSTRVVKEYQLFLALALVVFMMVCLVKLWAFVLF